MKPEGSKVNYQELAERFYTLDTEVYEASGSELGKVFPGPKHISVKQILKDFEREDTEKLKDELILAYSTASSESVLPRIIEKMEAYGAPASITSFVVPTGYSFNLDGSTLYQSIAAIFIAQLYGIDLSIWQEIILVLTLMVTSKGIAGVPGVSFVVLLATLGSVGIPLEGLAFIAGVDRILDMARTALNVVGNALAVLVIAKWEHKFDRKKALAYEREVLGKFDKTADQ